MHVVRRTALGLCLGALVANGAVAQERTVEQLLLHLNEVLGQNPYADHNGDQTTSHVRLPGDGTLVVEIGKRKGGNVVASIYTTALRDLDPDRVVARRLEDHATVSLGATGEVQVTMRCTMPGGVVSEWLLPPTRELVVEFRKDDDLADGLSLVFMELIRRAKADPRYAAT